MDRKLLHGSHVTATYRLPIPVISLLTFAPLGLKCVLEKCDVDVWIGLSWLRMESCSGLLSTQWWSCGCSKSKNCVIYSTECQVPWS